MYYFYRSFAIHYVRMTEMQKNFSFYLLMLLIHLRIFNTSTLSSSLNILSLLLPHFLHITEKTNILTKMYFILGFLITILLYP